MRKWKFSWWMFYRLIDLDSFDDVKIEKLKSDVKNKSVNGRFGSEYGKMPDEKFGFNSLKSASACLYFVILGEEMGNKYVFIIPINKLAVSRREKVEFRPDK